MRNDDRGHSRSNVPGEHSALRNLHSALEMAAGDGLAPPRSPSKGDVLLLDDPAHREMA